MAGRVLRWVMGVFLVGGAFLLGRWSRSDGAPPPRIAPVPSANLESVGSSAAEMSQIRSELAQMRRQLKAQPDERGASPSAPDASTPPQVVAQPETQAPTAESSEAGASARRLVDDAVQHGAWGSSDARAFHELLPRVDPAVRNALVHQLMHEFNSGRVKNTAGPRWF